MTRLRLAEAETALGGALHRARGDELAPIAVAVPDAGGHLLAPAREDGAGFLRPQIAIGKAWGALGMGMGVTQPVGKSSEFLGSLAAMSSGKVVPSPGGS